MPRYRHLLYIIRTLLYAHLMLQKPILSGIPHDATYFELHQLLVMRMQKRALVLLMML